MGATSHTSQLMALALAEHVSVKFRIANVRRRELQLRVNWGAHGMGWARIVMPDGDVAAEIEAICEAALAQVRGHDSAALPPIIAEIVPPAALGGVMPAAGASTDHT
jgi:hypothetical protein